MKVLLINGSPKANGNTACALKQMAEVFDSQGISWEMIHVGHLAIRGCVCCKSCKNTGKCAIDDIVNEVKKKLLEADGMVLASPVYYAAANSTLTAFCDRLFYSTLDDLRMKVGACVVSARRSGCTAAFDQLNKYFTLSGMPVASSSYWNNVHGSAPGEAAQDEEGIRTVRNLAHNMSFLMKAIALGKEQYGMPMREEPIKTNFIR